MGLNGGNVAWKTATLRNSQHRIVALVMHTVMIPKRNTKIRILTQLTLQITLQQMFKVVRALTVNNFTINLDEIINYMGDKTLLTYTHGTYLKTRMETKILKTVNVMSTLNIAVKMQFISPRIIFSVTSPIYLTDIPKSSKHLKKWDIYVLRLHTARESNSADVIKNKTRHAVFSPEILQSIRQLQITMYIIIYAL